VKKSGWDVPLLDVSSPDFGNFLERLRMASILEKLSPEALDQLDEIEIKPADAGTTNYWVRR
jgi:hypothetical protein